MARKTIRVQLGHEVKDAASGITGIATTRHIKLNGNVMFGIQPKAKKGADTTPEGVAVDEQQVIYVGKGIVNMATAPMTPAVALGQQVEDIVTGMKGIAVEQVEFMNGCTYFSIQGKKPEGDKAEVPKGLFVEHQRLKTVGVGVTNKMTTPIVAPAGVKSTEVPPGGPSVRLSNYQR